MMPLLLPSMLLAEAKGLMSTYGCMYEKSVRTFPDSFSVGEWGRVNTLVSFQRGGRGGPSR